MLSGTTYYFFCRLMWARTKHLFDTKYGSCSWSPICWSVICLLFVCIFYRFKYNGLLSASTCVGTIHNIAFLEYNLRHLLYLHIHHFHLHDTEFEILILSVRRDQIWAVMIESIPILIILESRSFNLKPSPVIDLVCTYLFRPFSNCGCH